MKKSAFSVFVSIIALVALVGVALAEATALPGSGWYSGETIQNVGSGTATIDITAYDSASANTFNLSDSITPGSSKVYLPNSFPGMPSGFQGSAIVSSNQDIRAIVNVTNRYLSSLTLGDPLTASPAAAIYQGMNAPSTTLNFPLAKNDYFGKTTSFFIQNAGTAAATVTTTFKFLGVITPLRPRRCNPVRWLSLFQPDGYEWSGPPPTGNTAVGGMIATSSQPLSGTVLEHKTVEVHATVLQATRAFTAADYNTTLYVPVNKNNYFGRFTGIQVQNVTGGAVDVSVEYSQTAGGSCPGGTKTDSHTGIPAGQSWNFPSSVLDPGCLASAVITGSGNIVAIVSESYTAAFLAANPGRFQKIHDPLRFPWKCSDDGCKPACDQRGCLQQGNRPIPSECWRFHSSCRSHFQERYHDVRKQSAGYCPQCFSRPGGCPQQASQLLERHCHDPRGFGMHSQRLWQ